MDYSNGDPCCGTEETSMIWYNYMDTAGLVCSIFVWVTMLFAWSCSLYFYTSGYFNLAEEIITSFLLTMSLWSHGMVMLSDPGSVPKNAQPYAKNRSAPYTMCGRCDAYKPPKSHHDRVSNRCIVRMDHYCPWTNNAIGAGNQKMFILFIVYTDVAALYYYHLIGIILVFCNGENCPYFEGAAVILARILLFLLLFAVLFTTSMILNQVYGIATGLGTIDRMKLKKGDYYVEDPIPLSHVFGVDWWFFAIPTVPRFDNRCEVMGYAGQDDNTSEEA